MRRALYRFEILNKVDPNVWNNNLQKSNYATFFQTYEYLTSSSSPSISSIFIIVFDENDEVKGQLGLQISSSVKAHSSLFMKKLASLFSNVGKRASWVSGPIIHEDDKNLRVKILEVLISSLREITKKYELVLIDGYTPPLDLKIDNNFFNTFKKHGYKIQNFFTFVTNLNDSLDEIWNNIHKSTRRDVVRAQKRNIEIKELTKYEQLDEYFQILEEWSKTKGLYGKQTSENKKEYWDYVNSGIEKLFMAYEDGKLVTTHRLGWFNGIAYSHKIINSYSRPTSLGGPLLMWHAIEWAKKSKMRIFDFSGGESPPLDDIDKKKYNEQWDSLLSYKRKWGGSEFPYYHVVKVQNNWRYKLIRALTKLDWSFRNYKRKHYKRPKAIMR